MLMSKKFRDSVDVHQVIDKRSSLPAIDRELGLYEIAQLTRSNPARVTGLDNKGHLGKGADADIAVYDINPLEVGSSDYEQIVKALSNAYLTIKGGRIVCKEGEVVDQSKGDTYWVNSHTDKDIQKELGEYFKKYYSVSLSNYNIGEEELDKSKAKATPV